MHLLQRFCYLLFGTLPMLYAAWPIGLMTYLMLHGLIDPNVWPVPISTLFFVLIMSLIEIALLMGGLVIFCLSFSLKIPLRARRLSAIFLLGGVAHLLVAISVLWPPPYGMDLHVFLVHPLQALWGLRDQILGWGPPFVVLHYFIQKRPWLKIYRGEPLPR